MNDLPIDPDMIRDIARPIVEMLIDRYEKQLQMLSDEEIDEYPAMPQFKIELADDFDEGSEEFLALLEEQIHRDLDEYYRPAILH